MALHHAERPARDAPPLASSTGLRRVRLAAEIVSSLVRARRALRRAPIDAAVASLRGAAPAQRARRDTLDGSSDELGEARRLGRAVTRMLVLMPGDTRCLTRSLVLTDLLARRQIPATLVIGARTSPSFLAHAWVEHAGVALLPAGGETFGRLVEL